MRIFGERAVLWPDVGPIGHPTGDQAATTEEVASTVDPLVADLSELSEEVETIATANEEQTAQIHGIAETAEQLASE